MTLGALILRVETILKRRFLRITLEWGVLIAVGLGSLYIIAQRVFGSEFTAISIPILASAIAIFFAFGEITRIRPRKNTAAELVDQLGKLQDHATVFSEIQGGENTSVAAQFVEKQAGTILSAQPDILERLPKDSSTARKFARIIVLTLLVAAAIILWQKHLERQRLAAEMAQSLAAILQETNLSKEVADATNALKDTLEAAALGEADEEQIAAAVEQVRRELSSPTDTNNNLHNDLSSGNGESLNGEDGESSGNQESTDSGRSSDNLAQQPPPTATPTPTPTPTSAPEEQPQDVDVQNSKPSDSSGDQQEDQQNKEKQPGQEQGEQQKSSGADQQGDSKEKSADGQQSAAQGASEQGKPEDKNSASQGGGSTQSDQRDRGSEKKEDAQSGQQEQQEKTGSEKSQGGSQSGEQKLQEALEKIEKEQLGKEESKKEGESKDGKEKGSEQGKDQGEQESEQGEKGDSGGGESGEQQKESKSSGKEDNKSAQPSEKNEQGKDQKHPNKAGAGSKQGNPAEKESKESKGQAGTGKEPGKESKEQSSQQGDKDQNGEAGKLDSKEPPTKGAMPGANEKSPAPGGMDGESKDLGSNKGFVDQQVNEGTENIDSRFAKGDGKLDRNTKPVRPKTSLADIKLARPESDQLKESQPIPLEYQQQMKR